MGGFERFFIFFIFRGCVVVVLANWWRGGREENLSTIRLVRRDVLLCFYPTGLIF